MSFPAIEYNGPEPTKPIPIKPNSERERERSQLAKQSVIID
jgi:hypothetical protein